MYRDTRVRPVSYIDSATRISYRVSARLVFYIPYTYVPYIGIIFLVMQFAKKSFPKRFFANCKNLTQPTAYGILPYIVLIPYTLHIGNIGKKSSFFALLLCIDSCIAILLTYRLVYRLGKNFGISHSLSLGGGVLTSN